MGGGWVHIANAGLIPNIPENPRNRQRTKRGRKRLFNVAIHALRYGCESSALVPGKTSASGGGSALHVSSNSTMA